MKLFICFFTCLLPLMVSANNPQEIVDGNNKFAFNLYHQVQYRTTGNNLFYSPFSISTALAMVYAGARNETAQQISQTMNFPQSENFHSDYNNLLDRLNNGTEGKIELNIVNGLWVEKKLALTSLRRSNLTTSPY